MLHKKILDLYENSNFKGWSDLHIQEGSPLSYRDKHGTILKYDDIPLPYDDINSLFDFDLREELRIQKGDIDRALELKFENTSPRFRCNIHFFNGQKIGLVMRLINDTTPDINTLGLPPLARSFNKKSTGLVLVTGATGSGKSTTLAAMIEELNNSESCHIVTVEDPIEYVYKQNKAKITQREIGDNKDSISFSQSLRAALRQDPDVILVGEIRDMETANMCLEAAQTGHLVFGTLHTKDSIGTVNRFIQMFPPSEKNKIRGLLADSLIGVISQVLVPKKGGGKIMACEVLGVDMAAKNIMADTEKNIHELGRVFELNAAANGNITLNKSLLDLVIKEIISPDTAKDFCVNSSDMEKRLKANNFSTENYAEESIPKEQIRKEDERKNSDFSNKTGKGFLNNLNNRNK